jgi:hypothetical protein
MTGIGVVFRGLGTAHVPAKWPPVRRQEHAPNMNLEPVPAPKERNKL